MSTFSLSSSSLSRRAFLKRSAIGAAAVTAGPALLSACGSGPAAKDGKAMTFLSILPLETLALAPELLAVAGGHFAKHGLDVELQPVKGSPQAMQTLLSGVAPVSRVGQIDVMSAVAGSDQPLVNIGTLSRGSSVRVIYSKQDPLEKPEHFLGKTIGVPSEGGTSDRVVSLVLANAGLDPAKTPRQVTGLTPGTFNLVQQKRIAGYVVSIDTATIVQSQFPDAGVFDPGTVVKSDSQVYVTTKDALQKNADQLKGFMAGIADALGELVADNDFGKTIPALRQKYKFATLNDDAIARASLTESRRLWTGGDPSKPLLVTEKNEWVAGYQELIDANQVKPGGDAASWFDNSLLPESKQ